VGLSNYTEGSEQVGVASEIEPVLEFALHYDPWVNGGHGEFFKN
jgi:hypothetical protein